MHPEIWDNLLENNTKGIVANGTATDIRRNLIIECNTAIEYSSSDYPEIVNNTIVDCGLVFDFDINTGNAEIYNNILSDNDAVFNIMDPSLHICNNLFWHNINNGLAAVISTVNYNGDNCDIYYNIFEDPCFVNSSEGDYHLEGNSHAINAGIDDLIFNDPDGSINDIGAFYYQSVEIDEEDFPIATNISLYNYPNPFNPETTIFFDLPLNIDFTDIVIYNIKGEKVRTLLCENKTQVVGDGITQSGCAAASGIYFYSIKNRETTLSSAKMILIK